MKYFVRCTRADSTIGYIIYDGMDDAAVTALLTSCGATGITFLSESDFNTGLAAQLATKSAFQG